MDFDSIVTFLFIIAFFVLPSILKQIQARKKKAAPGQKVRKKPSIFGKISDQIREFILEIERQAREQNQKKTRNQDREQNQARPAQPSLWEALKEDEQAPLDLGESGRDTDFGESSPLSHPEKAYSENAYLKKTSREKIGPEFEERFQPQKEAQQAGGTLRKDQWSNLKDPGQGSYMRPAAGAARQAGRFKSNPLQNAVVWSEILSKPIALRDP